jgi:hypothetical protein
MENFTVESEVYVSGARRGPPEMWQNHGILRIAQLLPGDV